MSGRGAEGLTAVVLPGSGSDDDFVRRAFAGPLRAVGIRLVAPAPRPGRRVVDGYRTALDTALDRALDAAAAGPGRLLVGGVSLGAHVAARWAADRPGRVAGLLLALPAWTGAPADAPAALASMATAARVRSGGLTAAVAEARAGSPPWLGDELERAWRGYGDGLADALLAAAREPGPEEDALGALDVPAGVVGLVDDPVHPLAVARRWSSVLPRAALVTASLAALGGDPAVLGRAAVLAWLRARLRPHAQSPRR